MLKEGYEKVINLSSRALFLISDRWTAQSLDKTRFIQNGLFSEMDGSGCRI